MQHMSHKYDKTARSNKRKPGLIPNEERHTNFIFFTQEEIIVTEVIIHYDQNSELIKMSFLNTTYYS